MKKIFACALAAAVAVLATGTRVLAASDIVVYASGGTAHGNWSTASSSGAAGGQSMSTPDAGWSTTTVPLAAPTNYFDVDVSAPANTAYRVWLRLRAGSNSKWNDSVWVQFSDAIGSNGAALHRIGTTGGLLVNLERCQNCGTSGWGWLNSAYWLSQEDVVRFAGSGTHTIRVQTREDGVEVDQIVLSPSTYMSSAPGPILNDATVLPASGGSTSVTTSLAPSIAVASLPGTVAAADFDNGGEGVSYHDATAGNTGGAYRQTDVDLAASSEGGYTVGWISAGEWLNYTVNVPTAGSYTAALRVAAPSGGSTLHLGFNGPSNVWTSVTIPATGGWQNWTTVNVPVSLGAGLQQITLMFDTSGYNVSAITVSSGSGGGSGGSSSGLSPYSGTPVSLPGTVPAANFDNGGEGVAYHDTTSGNSGGAYRSTNVDLAASSEGGYTVGWIAAGEWLNYTVTVGTAGAYTAQLRVAAPGGGSSLHIGFNGPSNVWQSVAVPATGGWQTWTTVSVPVTLGAGTQQITLMADTDGFNVSTISVTSGSSGGSGGSTPPPPPPPSGGSTDVPVISWNIQVNDSSAAHARLAMDLALATAPRPQIITIQEAYKPLFGVYIDELQRQTGQTWYGVFATHCATGQWNGSGCNSQWDQGVGIFTTYGIVNSDTKLFPYADCWTSARVGLRAAVNVNGTILQVFTTHLQTGNCSDVFAARHNSIVDLKAWAGNYAGPQIVSGDFNADPDQIDVSSNMGSSFIDTWAGLGAGYGATYPAPSAQYKIDYWFVDRSGRATATATWVDTNTASVSDHYPVRAVIRVQ